MTRRPVLQRIAPWGAILIFGAGWGAMQPANKVVVGGGFEPFGIMVWQGIVTLVVAGALSWRHGLPKGRAQWSVCLQIALLGTLIPHFASFTGVAYLPAGLMAIILSSIPVFALLMGLALGAEELTAPRALGLGLGLAAIAMIAAVSGGGFAIDGLGRGALTAVAIALVAPLCYALNSTLLARKDDTGKSLKGLHPLQAFTGSTVFFLPIAVLAAALFGQLKGLTTDLPSAALLATALGHTLIYSGFLWLVTSAGAVFASQTAYLVTGFGILWSMLFLGETYPWPVWGALGLMFVGLSLVRPR